MGRDYYRVFLGKRHVSGKMVEIHPRYHGGLLTQKFTLPGSFHGETFLIPGCRAVTLMITSPVHRITHSAVLVSLLEICRAVSQVHF